MPGRLARVLLVGIVTVSACSPYVYNQEISGFGSGVDALATSYQAGQQAVDTITEQQLEAADAAARKRLLLLPGCDQMDPSGTPPKLPLCAVVGFGMDAPAAPTAVRKNLADAAPAFEALKAYATALTKVTAAADETALNQATQTLDTAAGGLAGEVAKLHGAGTHASGLVTPAANLLAQGITFYLDQRRYAVLRDVVPAADADVQVLGQTVQAALLTIRAQQLLQLGTDLRSAARPFEGAAVSSFSPAEYQAKRSSLQAKIAAFNQARAADPTATVTAMVNAHRKLAEALEANTGQDAAVLTVVQDFVDAAGKLKTANEAAARVAGPTPAAAKATAAKAL